MALISAESLRVLTHTTTQVELYAYQKILKQNEEPLSCVCLCCSPPRSASAYYLLPRSLYLCTNGLRVSRARASPRCHGRPPLNGCFSVCLSLQGLRRVHVLQLSFTIFEMLKIIPLITLDNILSVSSRCPSDRCRTLAYRQLPISCGTRDP